MKILSLTLINFARIFSGLGKTKLEIDFTDIDNKINLFVGSNGTGKTSIMSCLHPFAYNSATGDATSNSDLIVEGKDGKKIIVISDEDITYEIQHVYTRKKDGTISVKSFIKQNGEELNSSGTVTTFKAIVQEKLGIDQTYLTLLSIGNTVKGFVDFTASDRKNYASKIFTELEIYAKHYKNLTALDRSMKTLLSSVTSKLSKYANVNKQDLEDRVLTIDKALHDLNSEKNACMQSIGGINNQLLTKQQTIVDYSKLEQELTASVANNDSLRKKLCCVYSITEALDKIRDIKDLIQTKSVALAELRSKVAMKLDMKDSKLVMLNSIRDNLSKMSTNQNVAELKELIATLKQEIADIQDKYDISMKFDLSKNDMMKAIIYLDELKSICDNLLTDVVDSSIIYELFDRYRKNPELYGIVNNEYTKAVNELQQYSSIMNQPVRVHVPMIRSTCKEQSTCQYKLFYDTYHEILNNSADANNKKLIELEKRVGKLADKLRALEIFRKCFDHIHKYESVLSKVGNVFDKNTFVHLYINTRTVYDVESAMIIMDTIENLEVYHELVRQLKSSEEKMDVVQSSNELYNSMMNSRDALEADIQMLTTEYLELKAEYDTMSIELSEYNNKLEIYQNDYDVLAMIDDNIGKIMVIKSQMLTMTQDMNQIAELREKLSTYEDKIRVLNAEIADYNVERNRLNVSISNIESLQNEEIEIRNKYDLISNIRSALSPTTGIPLEFIEYYIKEEVINKINELLDSVYHGRLKLLKDQVVIDDTNFTIPYIKNNTTIVKDISRASDGERAILSIAFSLVLIQLSSNKYNIMLLDEIDTSLDNESRGKFINLLESYMSIIQAEQLFLISHNNMFDSYPVCVLLTSDYQGLNYSQARLYKLCN